MSRIYLYGIELTSDSDIKRSVESCLNKHERDSSETGLRNS